LNRYAIGNIRPRLGSVLSPYTSLIIPTFDVTLKNGSKTQTVNLGFDSGLDGAHIQMPSTMARSFGIVPIESRGGSDLTRSFTASTGRIERITVPGYSGCVLIGGTVLFYDGAPLLIGNDFIRDVGAEISYESDKPSLSCHGPSSGSSSRSLPIFPVSIINKGKTVTRDALFDTGAEGLDVDVPMSVAQELSLPSLSTRQFRTHTGTVTMIVSKTDRLALKDLPECYAGGASVGILPVQSPIQEVIVGEEFFKKTGGKLGYDSQGAYFTCTAAGGRTARSSRFAIIPSDISLSFGPYGDIPPWVAGLVVAAGATLAAVVIANALTSD